MSKSLKDLTYLISSNIILKALGIVSVMVYTRFLMKEELALIPLLAIMGRLSMVVFSFGILPTLVRDIPHLVKNEEMYVVRSAINTSLIVIVPGIFLFSIICYFYSDSLSHFFLKSYDYTQHLKLLSIGFFFTGVNQAFSYIYWSLSRYQQESKRVVIIGVIQIVTSLFAVYVWGIFGMLCALVLTSSLNTVMFVYNLRDLLLVKSFAIYPLRKLIPESMPFYLESYLQYFRAEGDQLLVASLLGPNALALYFIARKPYDFLFSFTQSMDKILTTSLAKFKDDMTRFNQTVNSIITLNSYIIFPVIFFVIGLCPSLITIIAGNAYKEAIIPSIFLLLWLIIQVSWKTALGKSIFILKPSTGRFKVTLVETATLLILMFLGGQVFQLNGIVSGRFIATIIAGFYAFHLIKGDVLLKLDLKIIFTILAHSIAMCSLLLLAQYMSSSMIVLVCTLLFTIALFLFLINRTVSEQYYMVLNTVSPVKVSDPFKYVYSKVRALWL